MAKEKSMVPISEYLGVWTDKSKDMYWIIIPVTSESESEFLFRITWGSTLGEAETANQVIRIKTVEEAYRRILRKASGGYTLYEKRPHYRDVFIVRPHIHTLVEVPNIVDEITRLKALKASRPRKVTLFSWLSEESE